MIRRAKALREEQLLESTYKAWTNPGINRQYHERMKAKVRQNMPVLAKHLDELAKIRGDRA